MGDSRRPGRRAVPERKLYRVDPNCETWPNTLTENPYYSPKVGPQFGPTLHIFCSAPARTISSTKGRTLGQAARSGARERSQASALFAQIFWPADAGRAAFTPRGPRPARLCVGSHCGWQNDRAALVWSGRTARS
jgi:hypothetical protein